ncbi:MAG: polyketide antibiotic transporter [Solirubrobacteraceae bacterium]
MLLLVRRQLADHRRRTLAFGALFAGVAYIQPAAYRHAYPTLASRESFARTFGGDKAIRLFYGVPHDLLTIGGYTAWRVGAVLAVVAGIWGLVAAAGALRGEEDALRAETVLALPVDRTGTLGAALTALAVQAAVILFVLWGALLAAGLPAPQSAFLAIAVGSTIPVFIGIGALASQLVATRRRAVELAAGCLALAFATRVLADTAGGVGWLRWLSPMGWVEEMRPFAHPAPAVLALPAAAGAALIAASLSIARRRDVGTAVWQSHDARLPRRWGLGSPEGFALRSEAVPLLWWLIGIGTFAALIGMISKSVSAGGIPPALRRELARVGGGTVTTPAGYLGFTFLIFVLVLGLFACSQVSAARTEELEGRLETMLAAALGRARWLAGRLLVAAAALGLLSLTAALLAWSGARAAGARVSLSGLLEAASNGVAVGLLFLGLGALAYALVPRAATALAYGLVTVSFLWQLFGSALGAPRWLINLSPFAHLGLAPAQPFRLGPVIVMAAIGLAGAGAAAPVLRRRDLAAGA